MLSCVACRELTGQQPPEVLNPLQLQGALWENGHYEAAAMVIAAMMVSKPNGTSLIGDCAHSEAKFDAVKACQNAFI